MLSIIISSYQPAYFAALEKNVAESIGIPYEIVKIDNPGLMGICEAYNKGANKAKYDSLLFLHEDTEFVTVDWGKILINHLNLPPTGVVGLAGCAYIPNVPFAWWDNFEDTRMSILQYNSGIFKKNYTLSHKQLCPVLDGVFLACRKSVWIKYNFNECISGFHAYDVDFTARVAERMMNYVINDIKIKHFSEGTLSKEWWIDILGSRKFFSKPLIQKTDKKKELIYFKALNRRLDQFSIPHKKFILLKYNNPKYIGYKACVKNLINICFE